MSKRASDGFVQVRRPTTVDEESALAILLPLLEHVSLAYEKAGLTRLAGLSIQMSAEQGGTGRNYAACRTDGRLIVLSPDMIDLPEATATAILAHELGHAADFLYPGLFVPGPKGTLRLLDSSKKGVPTGENPVPASWIRDWKARGDDEVERMADAIAEQVLGVKIGYAGPCLLQTIDAGIRPRPLGLR